MPHGSIFTSWTDSHGWLWGRTPLFLRHRLHERDLFSDASIARLLETHPREHHSVFEWGQSGVGRGWREGEMAGLSGEAILEAVRGGRVWINLRDLPSLDPRFDELAREIFGEIEARVPDLRTFSRTLGLLVSSPGSRTIYHADLPGQSLWQIRGVKRVHVYPAAEPFLTRESLETIAVSGNEMALRHEPWFDEHASVFDIGPGEMLHWPLNAPHRVDNHDCLNVSLTSEYFTREIRRSHMVARANGILRERFGLSPSGSATSGPSFWAKAALQRALRAPRGAGTRARPRRLPEFRLDPTRPGGIAEIARS